jgi:hypothetical protein
MEAKRNEYMPGTIALSLMNLDFDTNLLLASDIVDQNGCSISIKRTADSR